MKCKLCTTEEATKKNTHYLTDSIIRTCLNLDGTNDREKGYFFEMSSNSPFIDFGFQRSTNQDEIEKALKRLPTDVEIKNAKLNPFSVDFHFCEDCERLFGSIESDFLRKVLPIIQSATSSPIEIKDSKLIRLFSYLQLWRSSVCDNYFKLPEEIEEPLRFMILNYSTLDYSQINDIPISVTFLETIGEKTHNFVSLLPFKNPYVIYMNDFVIQLFPDKSNYGFEEFYGLNDKTNYESFINFKEEVFKVHFLIDEKRKSIISKLLFYQITDKMIKRWTFYLNQVWQIKFGIPISKEILQIYINETFIETELDPTKYSEETLARGMYDFIEKYK